MMTIRTILLTIAFMPALFVQAHDARPTWIPGRCCSAEGPNADCQGYDRGAYREGQDGYDLTFRNVVTGRTDRDFIPYAEATPVSQDGRLWVCRDPLSQQRRCVFSPPQSN